MTKLQRKKKYKTEEEKIIGTKKVKQAYEAKLRKEGKLKPFWAKAQKKHRKKKFIALVQNATYMDLYFKLNQLITKRKKCCQCWLRPHLVEEKEQQKFAEIKQQEKETREQLKKLEKTIYNERRK